jgi:hypothetical protein
MNFKAISRAEQAAPFAALWNLEHPQDLRSTAEAGASYLLAPDGAFEEHWLADGCVVTAIDLYGSDPIEILEIEVVMRPELEAEHLAEVLEFADAISRRSGAKCTTFWMSERNSFRKRALETTGFNLVSRVPVTRLDLTSFDPKPFQGRVDKVRDQGIRLTTIEELTEEGFDWIPALHEATWEMVQDMPRAHPPVRPPLAQWREMVKNRTVYVPDLMFVAMAGDELVGYSRLMIAEAMPELARTGLSGTTRSYRRKGIVTALKVMQCERLLTRGQRLLQTDNNEENVMYGLNLELGFRDQWSWLLFEKKGPMGKAEG